MSKKNNKIKGNFGEKLACKYLEKKDYTILERNFTSYRGEIDIIAFKNQEVIFVEVKTRTQILCGNPAEAVNIHKIKQLYKVAEYYLYSHHLEKMPIRFDIIEIFLYGSHSYKIHHIQDTIFDSPFS